MKEPTMIGWHRLFGLTLKDFLSDTGYEVELEKDLSVKQQFLDVVIIEKEEGKLPEEMPDSNLLPPEDFQLYAVSTRYPQKNSARPRFESHFGEVNLGYPTGTDNEGIDADLAKEYAR